MAFFFNLRMDFNIFFHNLLIQISKLKTNKSILIKYKKRLQQYLYLDYYHETVR